MPITNPDLLAGLLARYQEIAQKKGGQLLTERWRGRHALHEWRCALGHTWCARPAFVSNGKNGGTWCPTCAVGARPQNVLRPDNLSRAAEVAARKGGRCLAQDNGPLSRPVLWECARGHRWKAPFNRILSDGAWCRHCRHEERSRAAAPRRRPGACGSQPPLSALGSEGTLSSPEAPNPRRYSSNESDESGENGESECPWSPPAGEGGSWREPALPHAPPSAEEEWALWREVVALEGSESARQAALAQLLAAFQK